MHANFQSVQTFSQRGRFTADLVWALRDAYVSIQALFGKVGIFVATVLSFVILRVALWWLIRQLKKDFRTDFDITPDNYKDLKIAQTALGSKTVHLARLKQVNSKKLPFLLRGVFNQIFTILSILENYNTALHMQLAQLDKLDTGDTKFEIVTESELWSMRTPHYEYRF
jgi:hypothetical protein